MKIIHVIGSFDPAKGGPQAVVVRLAAAQAALGHDVTILSYSDDAISARALKATAAIPGFECVKTFMLPIPDLYEVLTGSRAAKALSPMIASADFVHMHGVWETILLRASILCRKHHIPYCICCCGMLDIWSMRQKRWKKRIAFNLAFRRMLNGAAFIQALNQDEVDLMRPLRLTPPVVIIANGIFLEELETSEGKPAAVADRPYILFLSTLQKGSRHPGRCVLSDCRPLSSNRPRGGRSGRWCADPISHCDRQGRINGARPSHRRSLWPSKDRGFEKCSLLLPAQSSGRI
jgi:glycosyltransferase involved in cell wall biosynthesis